jgi:hypothetical protein
MKLAGGNSPSRAPRRSTRREEPQARHPVSYGDEQDTLDWADPGNDVARRTGGASVYEPTIPEPNTYEPNTYNPATYDPATYEQAISSRGTRMTRGAGRRTYGYRSEIGDEEFQEDTDSELPLDSYSSPTARGYQGRERGGSYGATMESTRSDGTASRRSHVLRLGDEEVERVDESSVDIQTFLVVATNEGYATCV